MNVLLDYLLKNLEENPDQPALICGQNSYSYHDLCGLIACHLQHYTNNQIQPQAPVGLILRNSPEFVVSYYSVLFYGAIPVLFPTNISSNRLTYFVNKLQIEALISQPDYQKTIDEVEIRKGENLLRLGCDLTRTTFPNGQNLLNFLRSQPGYQQPNLATEIVFSTGYGSYNKVIVHHQGSLEHNATILSQILAKQQVTRVLVTPPLTFFGAHAFVPHTLAALGGTIILLEKMPPEEIVKNILNGTIEAVVVTPTFLERLLSIEITEACPPPLFLIVGSQLTKEQFLSLRQRFQAEIYQFYGTAETQMVFLNSNPTDQAWQSVGKPLPGWEIRLEDPLHLKPYPNKGLLAVRGKSLMLGYYDDYAKAPLTAHHWFITGDWFKLEDENYYYQCQQQECIRRFGYSFNPAKIESILRTHPQIANAIAIAQHQLEGDDQLKLLILPAGELSEAEVWAFCQSHLPPYWQPNAIELVQYFERDYTGKTLRNLVNKT